MSVRHALQAQTARSEVVASPAVLLSMLLQLGMLAEVAMAGMNVLC